MMILVVVKVKGGYAIKHCHGKKKGRIVKGTKHRTKAGAVRQHKAIMARKAGRGKR